ncbi:MAG: HNH endonuclease [Gemmatimonadaceae bacterium]
MVHKHRDEVPIDVHHILPKSHGGVTSPLNTVTVCANGHREIHEYLRKLMHTHDGKVPWTQRRFFGKKVRDVAEEGYRRIVEAS